MGIVLSLFDGMSCLQIALKGLGIIPMRYYASEIDKHAIQVTQHNFPDTVQLGDITRWREWDIDWGDILLIGAGSPCQGFSFAGKQLAFDDPRSGLFFVFVEILNHVRSLNPEVVFLLENVRMKKEHQEVISRMVGVDPVIINSNLVSAQNRYRLYWTNIGDINQPEDRGILLKDILDDEVEEKYYLKNPKFGFEGMSLEGKANSCRSGGRSSQDKKHNHDLVKVSRRGVVSPDQGKASCFTAGGHLGGNHSDMDLICVAMRGRRSENDHRLEPQRGDKTNPLTSVSKDNLIMQVNPSRESGGKQPYQQNRVYHEEGITPALCANKSDLLVYQRPRGFNKGGEFRGKVPTMGSSSWDCNNVLYQDFRVRRLTPHECKRLQTVPDWYDMSVVFDTQQYRMLGNGWTVEVIKHILNHLNNDPETNE